MCHVGLESGALGSCLVLGQARRPSETGLESGQVGPCAVLDFIREGAILMSKLKSFIQREFFSLHAVLPRVEVID